MSTRPRASVITTYWQSSLSEVRTLDPADAEALEAFLQQHIAQAHPLLAQLADGGLDNRQGPLQAHYLAAFEKKKIKGLLALCNSGYVMPLCPDTALLNELVDRWAEWFKGDTLGLIGPREQIDVLLARLGGEELPFRFNNTEQILALGPDNFSAPLTPSPYPIRYAEMEDAEHLYGLRTALLHEVAGLPLTPELVEQVRADVDADIATGSLFMMEGPDRPVGLGQILDRQRGLLQIGGIYLLPELRNRGLGRALLAGLCHFLKQETLILFTTKRHIALNRAALRLGFHFAGEQSLILFNEPVVPST